ncbi:hypothetical protein J437_LFUL001649 [Ladona fulva]|uniref:Putative zinc-finger domain-containing protein n=1 Tax=Ladona fulva TaxID=123851 RepID=A0A8K0NYU6_LADFU|nr:hypothetical protein J437_LFUL001649 [Ladona fulva]
MKMQISILEMQKKRKAGELSQVPPKIDQKGVPVKSLPLSKSNQTSTKSVMEESKNNVCEPNNPLGLNSDLVSKDKEAQEKSSEKVSEESTTAVSDGAFDDNIEDENVMREQLLRSRLRKRAAAKAESSPALRESEFIQTLSSESNVEAGDLSKPKSAVQLSSSIVTTDSGEPPEMVKPVLTLDSEKEVISSEKVEVSSAVEPVMLESKVSDACDATSVTEEIPHTGSIVTQVVHVNTSLNDKLEDEKKTAEKREVISAKEGAVKNVSLEGKETTEKRQVTNVKVNVIKKVSEGNVLSEMRVNGREMATAKELPSHSIARGFAGTTKRVNLQSGVPSTHHGVDSKESQLKELESKLLSERHAALDYLRELQQLLNAMEFEGNRLREKEAAVKKLRTELSLAEVSLLTQKRLMKQLAMNVSSVRARVTETRHKCTLLSRACHKLGNQIKQEEIANGGERSTYRVPTGVAELVKSQLSSVLFHKKQLKKSGLPFLDPSQELTSKDGYSVKKSGKKFVRVHQQPNSLMWARNQLASNRSNLKVERNSPFSPSKFVKFVQSNSSLVKSGAASKSTADLVSVASTSTSAISTLPVAKGLMTSAKLSSTKESPNPPVAVLSANQTATKGVHVPDSNTSVVVAGPSSVTEDDVSSVSRTNVSSFILKPSDSSKKIDAEKSNPLREYESPLISISRTASEKLTTEISSHSENIQPEESTNLDPNVMLCPYDLRGVCQDEECTYQHQRRKGAAKKS